MQSLSIVGTMNSQKLPSAILRESELLNFSNGSQREYTQPLFQSAIRLIIY